MRAQSTARHTPMRRFSDKTPGFIGSTHPLYTNTHACEVVYCAFSFRIIAFSVRKIKGRAARLGRLKPRSGGSGVQGG